MVAAGRNVLIALAILGASGCRTLLGLEEGSVSDARSEDAPPDSVPVDVSSVTYRKAIVIDSNDGTLIDFTIPIVRASDPDLVAHARSDGSDLRFSADGLPLSFELVRFDGATGGFEAWVRIPSLHDQMTIDMEYGATSGAASTDAWPPFVAGAWHMTLANNRSPDSTSHALDASSVTPGGLPLATTGILGNALQFDGADDSLQVMNPANGALDFPDSFSVSLWIRPSSSTDAVVLGKGAPTSTTAGFQIERNSSWRASVSDGSILRSVDFGMSGVAGTWYQLAFVVDGSVHAYVNGAQNQMAPAPSGAFGSPAALVFSAMGNAYAGQIDEVRIYTKAVTASWLDAEHDFIATPADNVSFGAEEIASER